MPSCHAPVCIYRFHVLGRPAHTLGFPTHAPRILCCRLRTQIQAQVRLLSVLACVAWVPTIRHSHSFGIFRLTDPPGLQTILGCHAKEAFHPHPDIPIYTVRLLYLVVLFGTHVRYLSLACHVTFFLDRTTWNAL